MDLVCTISCHDHTVIANRTQCFSGSCYKPMWAITFRPRFRIYVNTSSGAATLDLFIIKLNFRLKPIEHHDTNISLCRSSHNFVARCNSATTNETLSRGVHPNRD